MWYNIVANKKFNIIKEKKMKKLLSLILVLTLALCAFVGCGDEPVVPDGDQTPGDTTPAEKNYTLAMGVVVSDSLATSKVTTTVASVVIDADGKIVLCKFDCVDYSAWDSEAEEIKTTAPTSKVDLGDYYTMPAGSWAKQTEALANYVKGMTQAEVAAIALNEEGKTTAAELTATCTFAIPELLEAIDNAFKSEHKVSFKSTATAFTAGLSYVGAVSDTSTDATEEVPASANAKYSVTFAGVVLAEGKVVAAILDTAESELKGITADGADSISYKGTKREQGDNYTMPAGAWYAQADAYTAAAVGLTAENVASLATEGVAGCTMQNTVGAYKAAIEKAVKAAK